MKISIGKITDISKDVGVISLDTMVELNINKTFSKRPECLLPLSGKLENP